MTPQHASNDPIGLFNQVEWKPTGTAGDGSDIPYATHEGVFHFAGHDLRCWLATEDGTAGKGTGRHIACFVLEPASMASTGDATQPLEQAELFTEKAA